MAYTSESLDILCIDEYAQGAERAAANDFVYNKVTEYSLSYDLGDNAYRKALAFHDKIISVTDYAYDEQGNPQSAAWAHNIMGVFEERGAVLTHANTHGSVIRLTESGKMLAAAISQQTNLAVQACNAHFNENEKEFFYGSLEKITENITKYYENLLNKD